MSQVSPQMEWTLLPPLTDELPYTFDNGAAFNGFNAECDHCGDMIELPLIKGRMATVAGNRCVLMAAAKCPSCSGVCHYHYLLNAEGELSAERLDHSQYKEQ